MYVVVGVFTPGKILFSQKPKFGGKVKGQSALHGSVHSDGVSINTKP